MKIKVVNENELASVMQHLNLLKVKFEHNDTWLIAPVLYTLDGLVEILVDGSKITYITGIGSEAIFKFQKFGYEYLVSGHITDISESYPATVTIKFSMAQKYYNVRKHMRFDTNLKTSIKVNDEMSFESQTRNISRGGIMLVSNADLSEGALINAQITFDSGNRFTAVAKVLRKSAAEHSTFSYGLQFVEISEDNDRVINKELTKYEKAYLKTLNILREYTKKNDTYFNSHIAIISHDTEESYEIREVLVKLGAENFEVFSDFKFYTDFFADDKPKIIIIDLGSLEDSIVSSINRIRDVFPGTNIIIMLPVDYSSRMDEYTECFKGVDILYKPLIYNEFEKVIIKYL